MHIACAHVGTLPLHSSVTVTHCSWAHSILVSESAPFSFLRGRPMCEGILWSMFPWFSVELSHSSLWIKELCYQLVYFGCWAGRARIQNVSFQTNWIAIDRILWCVRWSGNHAVLGSYGAKSLETSPPALRAALGKEFRTEAAVTGQKVNLSGEGLNWGFC